MDAENLEREGVRCSTRQSCTAGPTPEVQEPSLSYDPCRRKWCQIDACGENNKTSNEQPEVPDERPPFPSYSTFNGDMMAFEAFHLDLVWSHSNQYVTTVLYSTGFGCSVQYTLQR